MLDPASGVNKGGPWAEASQRKFGLEFVFMARVKTFGKELLPWTQSVYKY